MLDGDEPGADGGSATAQRSTRVSSSIARTLAAPVAMRCSIPYGLALEDTTPSATFERPTRMARRSTPRPRCRLRASHPDGMVIEGLDGLSQAVAADPGFAACLVQEAPDLRSGADDDRQRRKSHLEQARREWLAPGQTPSIGRRFMRWSPLELFAFGEAETKGAHSHDSLCHSTRIAGGAGWRSRCPGSNRFRRVSRARRPRCFRAAFLPIYLPNGAHEFWRPATSGRGDAWQLSSILDPFGAALKAKLNVLTNLENGSVFRADGTAHVEPSHSRLGERG